MQLRSLTLRGFRRFADAWVNLESPVTALVGPNEAGKSSVLEALGRINDDAEIEPTAITRGGTAGREVIQLRFRLADVDRARLSSPPGSGDAQWLVVGKLRRGGRNYHLMPPIKRPLDARRTARETIEATLVDPDSERVLRSSRTQLEGLAKSLTSQDETLDGEVLSAIQSGVAAAKEAIQKSNPQIPPTLRKLQHALQQANSVETGSWSDGLAKELADLVPQFLSFGEQARSLRTAYDLAKPPGAGPLQPNEALVNLLALAGLDREELLAAMKEANGQPALDSLFVRGERALSRALADWTQTDPALTAREGEDGHRLEVKFARQESTILHISVSTDGSQFHGVDARSDGLRTFVALRSFLRGRDDEVPPVLLVDEAEMHLHYDAQAELITIFEEELGASAVVYTTHSIGCLPRDLGRGVRVVAKAASGLSTIENAWSQAHIGSRPLVEAMGASTIPLTPSRAVVIAEGASEPILLPSLLRNAVGKNAPFQIVNRLSSASDDDLATLVDDAPRVAFLVDADESGEKQIARLRRLGFKAKVIVRHRQGRTLEDLIDPDRYVTAINNHLRAFGLATATASTFTTSDFGTGGRAAAFKAWCKAHGIRRQSHSDIAAEVLDSWERDESSDRRLTDQRRASEIRQLYARLVKALDGRP